MNDRVIGTSLGCVAAWALWGIVLLVLLLSISGRDIYLATIATAISAAAATATVRCYFVTSNRMVRTAVAVTQRDRDVVVPIR